MEDGRPEIADVRELLRSISKRNMNNEIQFILYQLPDEEGRAQVVLKDETTWATQKVMAQLFGACVRFSCQVFIYREPVRG